jgi:hypothetical protein
MLRVTKQYEPFGGYIADVYRLLFVTFDMKGYYDKPFNQLPFKKFLFIGTLIVLRAIFGRQYVYSHN